MRPRLLIAAGVLVLVAVGAAALWLSGAQDLKSRSALISVGTPRDEVERILGPPVLALPRVGGKGTLLVWTSQLWQVDVVTGPDGRTERVGCVPSKSFYRQTVGRLIAFP